MSKCPECNVNGVTVKDDCLTCGGWGIVPDITVKEHEEAIAEKDQRIAALEAERDEALRCLRRCGVAASDILTNHGGITAQAQHAMDNPLQADQMVNDRIAELECSEAQLKAENESLQSRLQIQEQASRLHASFTGKLPAEVSSVPHVEHDDLRKCRDALLAILDDPTVLLPVPKWEEKADPTGHPFWLLATIAGTFYSGQQQTDRRWWSQCFGRVEFHPSLSAAQAACEADYRERIRGAFQETKTAPGA